MGDQTEKLYHAGVTEAMALRQKIQRLEAELAAAKDLLAILHGDGGHHADAVGVARACKDAMDKYHQRVLQMDALAAHVERLVGALDTARVEALWIAQNTAPSGTDSGDLSTNRAARSMVAGIKAALAATPAQSLAAHDAALLREVARQMDPDGGCYEALMAEADRIGRAGGAKEGA